MKLRGAALSRKWSMTKQEMIKEMQGLQRENAKLRRQIADYGETPSDLCRHQEQNDLAQEDNIPSTPVRDLVQDTTQIGQTLDSGMLPTEVGVDVLLSIIDSLTEMVVLFDKDLYVFWMNKAAKNTFGDLVGQEFCIKLLKFGSCNNCDVCNVEKCLQGQPVPDEEVELPGLRYRETLHFRWSINMAAGFQNRCSSLLFSIFRDVTEKKELQSENIRAAQLASLGELAAGVAHEINNPVNAIVNLAQLLEEDIIEDKDYSTELVSLIVKEGQRIAGIVRNLLNFARKEQDESQPSDLKRILDEALDLTQVQMEKENIWVDTELPDDLPYVKVRGQEIQQVFINILSNARYALNKKFVQEHPEKAVFIKGEHVLSKQNDMVRIEFYDKGLGIPQSELSKICNPFYSTKPKGQGTGLGLSISHKIIQDHHGRMSFDSKEGEYTRVLVELPAYNHKENTNG